MEEKFKVGDKVRIVFAHKDYQWYYKVGETCTILSLDSPSGESLFCRFETSRRVSHEWYVRRSDVELIKQEEDPLLPKLEGYGEWIKHDGSDECPIDKNLFCEIAHESGHVKHGSEFPAKDLYWNVIKYYCVKDEVSTPEPKPITMEGTYFYRQDMNGDRPKVGAKPVRILCVDHIDPLQPVIFANERGHVTTATAIGRYFSDGAESEYDFIESEYDLIETEPLRKMTKFINKYGNVAKTDVCENGSYIFQNKVEFTFIGDRLHEVRLINEFKD